MDKPRSAPGKVWVVKNEVDWLKRHCQFYEGVWRCAQSAEVILMVETTHTIWPTEPSSDPCASNETRRVMHVYCPKHMAPPAFKDGSPILDTELQELRNG